MTIGGNMGDQDRIAVLHPMQLLDRVLSGKGLDGKCNPEAPTLSSG